MNCSCDSFGRWCGQRRGDEAAQEGETHLTRFFGMELNGGYLAALDAGDKAFAVLSLTKHPFANAASQRHSEGVDKVDSIAWAEAVEERRWLPWKHPVPSDLRHRKTELCAIKTADDARDNSKT